MGDVSAPCPSVSWKFVSLSRFCDSFKWQLDLLDLTLKCIVSPRPHLNSWLSFIAPIARIRGMASCLPFHDSGITGSILQKDKFPKDEKQE